MDMDHHDGLDGPAIDRLERRAILDIEPDKVNSPALRRLVQDIQRQSQDDASSASAYNRMHNRHNRGR